MAVASATVLTSLAVAVAPAAAADGFTVAGGRLHDATGADFVIRGVNHPHAWYPTRTGAFADIKAAGANTVRVVLSGGRWTPNTAADVAAVISRCKQSRLVCVLENHDTTGFGEQGGAVSLATAADYWIGLRDVLAGQERYVIINIGNEPYGNHAVTPSWAAATTDAIGRLRAAGLRHTLLVDAPNWGQDWQLQMRDSAAAVFAADPDRNTVFSIHMYGVFDTAAEIIDYLGRFRAAGLPIVVGEFGDNHSDGNPDENTILSYAQANGIGWLAWSWSGNGGGVEYLDLVSDFDPARLTTWGRRVVDGANGLRQTSREAAVYGGTGPTATPTRSPDPTPTVTPTPTGAPGAGCVVSYRVVGQWQGGFQGELTVTAGAAAITGWTVGWRFPDGQTVASAWNATVTPGAAGQTARNVDYNGRLAAGAATTLGFVANGNSTTLTALTCAAG